MDSVVSFLAKYKNLTPPEESAKKIILETIKDECGINLKTKDVSMKQGGVFLSCHPAVRSELIRCVPRIISTLQKEHNIRLSYIR